MVTQTYTIHSILMLHMIDFEKLKTIPPPYSLTCISVEYHSVSSTETLHHIMFPSPSVLRWGDWLCWYIWKHSSSYCCQIWPGVANQHSADKWCWQGQVHLSKPSCWCFVFLGLFFLLHSHYKEQPIIIQLHWSNMTCFLSKCWENLHSPPIISIWYTETL